MIAYEQLCEALERYNARRRNAAEMERLEQDVAAVEASSSQGAAALSTGQTIEAGDAVFDQGGAPATDEAPAVTAAMVEAHAAEADAADAVAAVAAESAEADVAAPADPSDGDYHSVDDDDIDESALDEFERPLGEHTD